MQHSRASEASLCSSAGVAEKRTEIAAASLVCGTCRMKVSLASPICPVCEAAASLDLGGYSFLGEKKALYDASTGPALANSVVFLARAKARAQSGEISVAMKLVPLEGEASSVEMARREIGVFRALQGSRQHPNLLPLLFGGEAELELVLLTPYAPAGDLDSLTRIAGGCYRNLEEREGAGLAGQMLAGLAALHAARFVHGDFKPQNIFLTETDGAFVAQIGDFGLTQRVPEGEDGIESLGGTTGYMAPELVGRDHVGPRPLIGFAADLFALGVLLYQLLAGMSPFEPASNVKAPLEFEDSCWAPLLPEARALVTELLAKEPGQRGTAQQQGEGPWPRLGLERPTGAPRPRYAPRPDPGLRFHSAARVQELAKPSADDA